MLNNMKAHVSWNTSFWTSFSSRQSLNIFARLSVPPIPLPRLVLTSEGCMCLYKSYGSVIPDWFRASAVQTRAHRIAQSVWAMISAGIPYRPASPPSGDLTHNSMTKFESLGDEDAGTFLELDKPSQPRWFSFTNHSSAVECSVQCGQQLLRSLQCTKLQQLLVGLYWGQQAYFTRASKLILLGPGIAMYISTRGQQANYTRASRHILLGPASNFTRPRNIFTRGQQTILLGPGIAVDIYTRGQQIILPGSSKQFY